MSVPPAVPTPKRRYRSPVAAILGVAMLIFFGVLMWEMRAKYLWNADIRRQLDQQAFAASDDAGSDAAAAPAKTREEREAELRRSGNPYSLLFRK